MRTLSITVTSPILSAGLVTRKATSTTVLIHRYEVYSTVKTARKLRHVNVERDLLVQHIEHFVAIVVFHKVDTRSNVLAVFVVGHELKTDLVTTCGDTVGTAVVCAFNRTILDDALSW